MPSFPALAFAEALCSMGGEVYPGVVLYAKNLLRLGARVGTKPSYGVAFCLPLPLSSSTLFGGECWFAPTWAQSADQFSTYVLRRAFMHGVMYGRGGGNGGTPMTTLWARLRRRQDVRGARPHFEALQRGLAARLGPTAHLGAHLAVRGAIDLIQQALREPDDLPAQEGA